MRALDATNRIVSSETPDKTTITRKVNEHYDVIFSGSIINTTTRNPSLLYDPATHYLRANIGIRSYQLLCVYFLFSALFCIFGSRSLGVLLLLN